MTNEVAGQPDGGGTYLRGGPGEPTLLVSDHVSDREARYRAQVRDIADGEIKDLVAKIERAATERRFAKPSSPAQRALEAARGAAWLAEVKRSREEPARLDALQAGLEDWGAKAMAELAARSDPPAPTRYGKTLSPAEQLYERQLQAAQAKAQATQLAAGCGSCWHCQTGQRCVYWVGS